jgi:hypothetical protein
VSDIIKRRMRVTFTRTVEESLDVEVDGFPFFGPDTWAQLAREEATRRVDEGEQPVRRQLTGRRVIKVEQLPDGE